MRLTHFLYNFRKKNYKINTHSLINHRDNVMNSIYYEEYVYPGNRVTLKFHDVKPGRDEDIIVDNKIKTLKV